VKGEFDAHRFEPAPMKAFKSLPFAQLGETGFDDYFAAPVAGARRDCRSQENYKKV
jgi:hypothetical protein